ncbi:MAG: PIN domain nuclease [Chlamydiae bacterium]|nr:PIN domain nuclease [Chlamydiota bacterium]MBI3276941.1 PIN domain nuclease [Chlamydiota bacterium]
MILVDTTVWIDFFRDKETSHVAYLEFLLKNHEDVCLCGVILTEILQGIRDEKEYHETFQLLRSLIFIEMDFDTFLLSADIYRKLKAKGVTIRKSIDCMIAAVAIENKLKLLQNDRDFGPIARYCGLEIVQN